MSAPGIIDSLEFARSQQVLGGSLETASLHRLDDLLLDENGTVRYDISGSLDARNRPQLELRITGRLHLQCQRCLEPFDFPLAITNTLLIAASASELDKDIDDPDAPDVIEASAALEVGGLIEDEILLSLPLAPRHPDGECEKRGGKLDQDIEERHSPFARLASFRRAT